MDILQKNGKLIFNRGPKIIKGFLVLFWGIALICISGGFLSLLILKLLNSKATFWANLFGFLIPFAVLIGIILMAVLVTYVGLKLILGKEIVIFTKKKITEKQVFLFVKHEKTYDVQAYSHIELKLLEIDDYRTGELSRIAIIPKEKKDPIEYPIHDGFEDLELYAEKISEITGLKIIKSNNSVAL